MPTLEEKQAETAGWLVKKIEDFPPDRRALWNLAGAVGSGKTTILRRVAEQLRSRGLCPITITAPAGEIDLAPIALLDTADQLKGGGLLNGGMTVLSNVKECWAEKMDVITGTVKKNHEKVVILADEPVFWYKDQYAMIPGTSDYFARSLADWIANEADCHRVITGRIPGARNIAAHTRAPRLDDGRELLESATRWDVLKDYATRLRDVLSEPVPKRSVWEMKLCVALAAILPVDEAAQKLLASTSADELLKDFFDQVQDQPRYHDLCVALAKLAHSRTDLSGAVLGQFTSHLDPLKRSLIEKCLVDGAHGRSALHPLVRHEILVRAKDSRLSKAHPVWRLSKADRMSVHDRLKDVYRVQEGGLLRDSVESLHHELLGSGFHPDGSDPRLHFVDQLEEIGRTLSYVHHEHRKAVELFRLAVQIDAARAYSHHYLAFNLDWLAEQSSEVEEHYRKATELQPTHPWWWSRWITYLVTRGRFREAKEKWLEAADELSLSGGGSSDWIFLSLHRWVARWLLHWAELDFAEEVLRSIPTRLAGNDASIQTLWDFLKALRQAERGISVFPLTVPSRDWWSPTPHTDLPPSWGGHPLRSWIPARVEGVDQEISVAFLVAARRPTATGADPEYFEMKLRRDEVDESAIGFKWDDLCEGSFIELGDYGGHDERMRIGLHREKYWNDPHLLPLVPPPDRWYRQAIEGAWAEEAEKD